jgi:hypothetical protein
VLIAPALLIVADARLASRPFPVPWAILAAAYVLALSARVVTATRVQITTVVLTALLIGILRGTVDRAGQSRAKS